jgi:hypothetical protein
MNKFEGVGDRWYLDRGEVSDVVDWMRLVGVECPDHTPQPGRENCAQCHTNEELVQLCFRPTATSEIVYPTDTPQPTDTQVYPTDTPVPTDTATVVYVTNTIEPSVTPSETAAIFIPSNTPLPPEQPTQPPQPALPLATETLTATPTVTSTPGIVAQKFAPTGADAWAGVIAPAIIAAGAFGLMVARMMSNHRK